MARVFIAFGSNIAPETNVPRALDLLAAAVRVIAVSTVYRTEPIGALDQDPFYNGAFLIETDLGPRVLKFELLRGIEGELGRVRTADRYAPRTIDLDIALYGDLVVSEPNLVIPDPDIKSRAFLAVPLAELAPEMVLPGGCETLAQIATRMDNEKMEPLWEFTNLLRRSISNEP
ncbi:MAG: 2-amino-4-hydroxy-6-hydroxymethyldihydropteridine diphosphokinase [Armatimonadetes bacterium]|nr:2-amino-4-hydroxy-6-hydroxymethyldihydropteridine diphosphokinase [Armatimonadota bacterium]